MKKFYTWYQKHITGAIFIGLILGILTGLFLAGRFEPVLTITSLLGSIYMNALNMMIFPLVFCSIIMGITSIGNARTTGKITGYSMIFFPVYHRTCQSGRTDHPTSDPSWKRS